MTKDGRLEANKRRIIDLRGKKFNRLTVVSRCESGWECVCDCGSVVFNIPSDKLKSGNTKSCGCLQKEKASSSMMKLLNKKRLDAGLSPDTKLSDIRAIDRAKLKPFRNECYSRDEFTCVWCSTRGVRLNAHHLSPWASNPQGRFDVRNMVTLCRDCHSKIHCGNYHGEVDVHMTILLRGYINEAYCFRKEVS